MVIASWSPIGYAETPCIFSGQNTSELAIMGKALSLSLSLSLSLRHTHSHSPSLSPSLSHAHTHTISLSLSFSLFLSLSLSLQTCNESLTAFGPCALISPFSPFP